MKLRYIFCVALVAFPTLTARSQTVEISPFYGWRWGGDVEAGTGEELSLDSGQAYGVDVLYGPRDSEIKMELLWSHQDSGIDLDGDTMDVNIDQFMIGGIYEERYGRVSGYLSLMVGASVFDAEGSDMDARFAVSVGGGVKYFITKNIALRGDVRGYCTVTESESSFISTGGVTLVQFTGSTFWQGEVTAGVTIAF
jgi:hypothetical protein